MHKVNSSQKSGADRLIRRKHPETRLPISEADTLTLIHELEVNQVELERLNEERANELIIANKELEYQNEEKEKRADELIIANKELLFQSEEKEKRADELIIADKELLFQSEEKGKRADELIIANKELLFQNREKEKRADELIIANKELLFQSEEKEKRADELIIANKELEYQNEEKEKRADELIIANKELEYQNEEKGKRADELIIANKELLFQSEEKEKRANELIIANKELLFQSEEKVKRADELIIANKELLFQSEEKVKRADELIIANKELLFQSKEKEKRADELIIANKELEYQNEEKEKRADELIIANKELEYQNEEKEKRADELIIANKELLFQSEEKEKRADELIIAIERAESAEWVMEAQEKLNMVLDNGHVGIWEMDLKTGKLLFDKQMEKMFGIEEGTFKGTAEAAENCLIEEDIPHLREVMRKAVEENVAIDTIYRVKSANGNVNHINSKGFVTHKEQGKAVTLAGVCFDITEMKKGAEQALFNLNEELLRSNKELGQFAYLASHDLQEPLRTISTFTQFLAKRYKNKLDEEGQQFIHYIIESALRMQELIHDLLTYSRIGSSSKPFSEVDFNNVLNKVIHKFIFSIEEKNASVTSDKLPSVIGDELQLVQLMQNLVGNALKFCDTTPRIHISANEDPYYFHFSVKDNGIGIEQQYSDRIFLIFQRLVSNEEYEGTGIGLAVCQRIVERHGGKIWIESQRGTGTTFYFTIAKNPAPPLPPRL